MRSERRYEASSNTCENSSSIDATSSTYMLFNVCSGGRVGVNLEINAVGVGAARISRISMRDGALMAREALFRIA